MRQGFEAITIKIKTEDKRALERRCLEDPNYGRWNGPKSYADLVRKAIEAFLSAPGEAKQQATIAKQIAGKPAQHLPAVDDLPFYVHRYRGGDLDNDEGESVCGLRGLADAHTTNIADNVTCPRCNSIRDANARALAAPARTRAAPKKAPKRASSKRSAKKGGRR